MSESGQETEAKFYVNDLDKIITRLQPPPPFGHLPQIRNKVFHKFLSFYSRIWGRLGGGLIQERVLETNIRFDLPDGRLRSEGRVLRLRQDTDARFTYKSPSTNQQGVLSRTEIEFTVGDFEKAKEFLEALGYQKLIAYEKYRTTYTLEADSLLSKIHEQAHGYHSCLIMLDELPYGNFVEIEGEAIELIRKVAIQLNLNWEAAIGTSYTALFDRARKKLGYSFQDLSFENFNGMKVDASDLGVHAADT